MERRSFLKTLAVGLTAIPAYLLGNSLTNNKRPATRGKTIQLTSDLPEGVSFHGAVIAVRKEDQVYFYHSKCTHLGCEINLFDGKQLVCPCHGSHFDLQGQVTEGPAQKPLPKLKAQKDTAKNLYTIQLPS